MTSRTSNVDLATWQEHFDFILPRKENLRADEVAAALGCDDRTVHRMFDDAQLLGFELNSRGEKGQRMHRRYRRASVILLLAKRANYEPADLRNKLLEVLAQLPRNDKAQIHAALGELIRRTA